MNEHIEHWKRFSSAYMRWVNFEFDRIVEDAVKRQEKIRLELIENEKKEKFKNSTYGKLISAMNEYTDKYIERLIDDDKLWNAKDFKIGSTLKIKLPS